MSQFLPLDSNEFKWRANGDISFTFEKNTVNESQTCQKMFQDISYIKHLCYSEITTN